MSADRRTSPCKTSISVLAVLVLTLPSLSGNPSPQVALPLSTRSKPLTTYTLSGGFWRTDGGFVSTIRIKNVLVVGPLDVTPALFMADGTRFALSAIHLPASAVATVNINEALASAPPSIASHISQYGSAALMWSYTSAGHVAASVAVIDDSRSLSFVFPFAESMGEPMDQILDGLWWKHDPGVSGYIALSNVTDADKQVSVQLVSRENDEQQKHTISLLAHTTQMLPLEELPSDSSMLSKQAGGIRVQYTGQPGSVQVVGGLENDAEGYSANIPFLGHDMGSTPPAQITYASAGVMMGTPDPMMMPGFPEETTFTPYLALRNTTKNHLDLSLQLNYMAASSPITRNLTPLHLAPFEARQVDMQAKLNSVGLKNFNGSINLSVSFSGKAGDLVLASGSVDQTGSYVFEVEPQGVARSRSKYTNYWSAGEPNDTMFTLWNPTDSPQGILTTFYYGDGSGHYMLPIHLAPQASVMIDMAMLIAENKPDPNGNIMPVNIREGSVAFTSAKGWREWITLVIAAGIYNVTNATCGGGCTNCCGDTNFGFTPNPIDCPLGGSMPCTSTAVDCNGYTVNPNYWSSSNSAIMPVNGSGVVTGNSVGSATITAEFDNVVVMTGQMCGGYSCPTNSPAPGGIGLAYTPVQHNYPRNPLQKACWISQYFDKIGNAGNPHRAEDVVYDNGQGTGGIKPAYGDPVYAMEAGKVVKVVRTAGPAPVGFPQCQGLGYAGNRVNIQDTGGYTTVYYHVLPLAGITVGTQVSQGQQIGTLDNSGCQSGPHLHVGRFDSSARPVNFTIPCTYPLPKTNFGDGLVDDSDTDVP